jgi:dipeptidase D
MKQQNNQSNAIMSEIVNLEPRLVWEQFDAITQVPRPSKKEGKIIDFLVGFAERHGLEYRKDAIGNVVMRKGATPGYEDRPAVILQSHMDMVCEKNSDVEFDFDNDPIRTRIDGEWVKAEGTTLGADCGIGMAAALAVLIDPAVEHGPLEALFTVDEETGLTGAFELGEGMLTGKYLVNLDSEDEGEIFIGCAGGIDTVATFRYRTEEAPKNYVFYRVDVSDLLGGHSGDDIDKGRVNSNKTVARLLWDGMQSYELKLAYFSGGNLRNAIPREAYAIFGIPTRYKEEFASRFRLFAADLEAEFRFREPNFRITINEMPAVDRVLDAKTQFGLVYALVGVPNGVVAMSFAMPGLVETSTNLASVKFEGDDRIVVTSSQRSSVESAKTYVMQMVESVFALAGADVAHSDGYPGWAPNPESELLARTVAAYERLFGTTPKVRAIHAGLECGLFLEKYPELEMVSFGPTLRGVHSPDERLEIATVPKFWALLLELLKTL